MVNPGVQLSKARKALEVSISELSNRSGISRETIYRVERGGSCRMATIKKLSESLGISAGDLFREPLPRRRKTARKPVTGPRRNNGRRA